MLKSFFCSTLFLSLTPLWISIIFIDILSIYANSSYSLLCTETISIIVIIIGFIASTLIFRISINPRDKNPNCYKIQSIAEEKVNVTEYILAYTLPLLAFDFTQLRDIILFLIFFFILVFLYQRHWYFPPNIALELAGYKFFKCNLSNIASDANEYPIEKIVISKQDLKEKKGEFWLITINNECFFHVMDNNH